MEKISFMPLNKAMTACTNFQKLANVQRHYMEGSLRANYTPISQEIHQLQEQIH
jgi:hypothetical protein